MDYTEEETEDTESDEESSGSDSDESDDDDEGSGYESIEEIIETVPGEGIENEESLKAFSSDDDPEKESCPICLNKFFGQDLGSPESCDHTFCFECIKEWSKIEVKVSPKEPEDALEELPTHCEVCHSGDREDRLLLCDGCDLAYHCECLDPPLFYIPIEEWFCPACSGVIDRRGVAGPSRSGTRRVIPRTRATEAVRSRVRNIQSLRTPRTPSVSQSRKSSTQRTPKRKKRRTYRKAIRKVVTLARTKKDMNGCQKGKLGTRTSTVIVTYRRRRRRRRTKKKVSRQSAASSKVFTIPSSKQRIARHLGIAKPLQGSTVLQIKKTSGSHSRSTNVAARLPSHSLFGNKDQLMDFSENYNEDMRGDSSTVSSKSLNRSSSDAGPSTSSGLSILDSIMAGQKILHAKSDKILIKTDGSLILKEDTKKQNNIKKLENDLPLRTPMSIALAKQGVRSSLVDKDLGASYKKHADPSKTKNTSDKKSKVPTESRSSVNKVSSESSSKLFRLLNNDKQTVTDVKKKISTKNKFETKINEATASEIGISSTELNVFSNDTSSVTDNNKTYQMNLTSKTKKINNVKLESYDMSNNKHQTKFDTLSDNNTMLSSPATSCQVLIKKEILSDEEISNDSITVNIENIRIKQENVSDEETNIDNWNNENHEFGNKLLKIKEEPRDPDLRVNTVPHDIVNTSLDNKVNISTTSIKVKEEIPSDNEDYSQSLLLDTTTQNLGSSSNLKNLIKKEPFDYNEAEKSEKENSHQNGKNNFIERLESTSTTFSNELPSTQALAFPSGSESDDDDLPCTQAFLQSPTFESEDEEELCTQAFPQVAGNDSEDDAIPSTQVSNFPANDSDDDDDTNNSMPCPQSSPNVTDSEEDDIPCAQSSSHVHASDSEDDKIPCAQSTSLVDSSDSENDEIPCSQPSPDVTPNSESVNLDGNQAVSFAAVDVDSNEDLPCTQAVFNIPTNFENEEDEDLPCTQISCISSKRNDKKSNTQTSFDRNENNNNNISDSLPLTQNTLCMNKNKATSVQVSNSKMSFEFKMPLAVSTTKAVSCENNNALKKNKSEVSDISTLSEWELPSTQAVTFSVPVSKSSIMLPNDLEPVKSTNIKHEFNLDDDDSNLLSTQVSCLNSKSDMKSNLEVSSMHVTKMNDINSQNMNKITVPEILNFKSDCTITIPDSQSSFHSESFDLPPTQISNFSAPAQKSSCLEADKSRDLSNSQTLDILTNAQINEETIHDTQVLPHTQSICSNSKESIAVNSNEEQDINCKKDLNEIISNIKQLVNSLSSNGFENQASQNNLVEISNNELSPNVINTSNNLMDVSESDVSRNVTSEEENMSNNSKDMLSGSHKESSFINTENKNKSNEQSSSDSDSEEFSLEKFKESLQMSKPATPKKFGIHKHLPQVITAVPIKENLQIKRSNKRTFSFEEVMKLQESSAQLKLSRNSFKSEFLNSKIFEDFKNDSNDSLPATQVFETSNDKSCKSSILQPTNNNLSAQNHLSQELTKNHVNEKPDFQYHILPAQDTDDFPATQDIISEAKVENLHLDNGRRKDLKSVSSYNSSQIISCKLSGKKETMSPICQNAFVKENISSSLKTLNVPSDVCATQKNQMSPAFNQNSKTEKDAVINISKKALVDPKNNMNKNSDSSIDFMDFDDLPATQIVSSNLISTNSDKIKKISINSDEDSLAKNIQNNVYKRKNSLNEISKNKKICHPIPELLKSENASSKAINDLKINCIKSNIKIKQEKEDFQFVKPSLNEQKFNSPAAVSCLNLNVIKIEKIDPVEDLLPPTQAIHFNHSEDMSLPQTQVTDFTVVNQSITMQNNTKSTLNNFLISHQIKKEPCSDNDDDDEVSVIEINEVSNNKVKEEVIVIDDDDDDDQSHSNLGNLHIKQENIPSKIIEVSNIKKEKSSEGTTLSESGSDVNLSIINNESKNACSEILKNSEKKNHNSAKPKSDCENHKQVELKNSKRKSIESGVSNKIANNSGDVRACTGKNRKNSSDHLEFDEEDKRNSKDPRVSKEKTSILVNTISEKKSTTFKDKGSQDKGSNLKESHTFKKKDTSKKDNKDCHMVPTSHEKSRKKPKTVSSSKEVVNVKLVNSHHSNENKHKINENQLVNSASKIEKKLANRESFSKKDSDSKHIEKSKDSSVKKHNSKLINDHYSKSIEVKNKIDKDIQKCSEKQNILLTKDLTLKNKIDKSSEKDNRCSSEKENRNKNNKEILITLKSKNKRSLIDTSEACNQKKRRLAHSLDSESNSSEDINIQLSNLSDDIYKYSKLDDLMKYDGISDRLSTSKDAKNTHTKSNESGSKSVQAADIKKVHSKQDLKEQIANEVKVILKPFYNTGLISKEDYKDIMRRAVPKIFMNCHNVINSEKIRKLILNYVSLLSNKS